MNILLIIVAIILILILITSKNNENMTDVVPYKLDQVTPSNSDINPNLNTKCCLIEKKYLPDNNSMYGGNFKYVYTSKENDDCNPSNYELNNNKQLIIGKKCNNTELNLGSCRMINNECVDFVDKPFCDKVPEMVWSEKTCQNPLEFVWQDKIVRNIPEKSKNDGSYVMFPEQFKKF